MQGIRKKRILALVVGSGLILLLLVLLWAVTLFVSNSWLAFLLAGLPLALVPVVVGGIVGAWIRGGSDRPWRRASGIGVIVWWLILLVLFFAAFIWYGYLLSTLPPDPGSGPAPGEGAGIFFYLFSIGEVIYAVAALPFILLGTALTYPRRGVAS
jgi:hypothetical protein